MSKKMSVETLKSYAMKILELRDAGFTHAEVDDLLDLPTIGGGHSFSWRFMNDGRVKSFLASL